MIKLILITILLSSCAAKTKQPEIFNWMDKCVQSGSEVKICKLQEEKILGEWPCCITEQR